MAAQSSELAVIFDLDGLLADTEPYWGESGQTLIESKGRIYDPSLRTQYMGRTPLDVARLMVQHYDLPDEPAALRDQRLLIMAELYRSRPLVALPGARDLVAALAAEGVPLAVASGSPGVLVKVVLQRLDLRSPMSVCLGSDTVEHGKPAPDLFLLAARRLGVEPRRCVVLEDAGAGVQAALAAGMVCVAVPLADTPLRNVAGATRVVRSLEEITPGELRALV